MAEKIPRITPEHVERLSWARAQVCGNASGVEACQYPPCESLSEIQSLVEGVASGKLVVIPRREVEALRSLVKVIEDATEQAALAGDDDLIPQYIDWKRFGEAYARAYNAADWLDENSAGTNQGATKENR